MRNLIAYKRTPLKIYEAKVLYIQRKMKKRVQNAWVVNMRKITVNVSR
jgi:hypothetical protein